MSAILADVIAGANEVTVTLTRLVLVLVESFGSPPLLTYSKRLTSIAGSSGLTTATCYNCLAAYREHRSWIAKCINIS